MLFNGEHSLILSVHYIIKCCSRSIADENGQYFHINKTICYSLSADEAFSCKISSASLLK